MTARPLDDLIDLLAKLPGLGPRSARRVALHLLKRRETLLRRLTLALSEAASRIQRCSICGNLDADPCGICTAPQRNPRQVCVVEEVDDLWALERSGRYRGRYHVLGGTLSAFDGQGPDDLGIDRLLTRVRDDDVEEVILATSATVDGQTTAHYVADRLVQAGAAGGQAVRITRLAHGVPVGGELNYLDDGTLGAALEARQPLAASPLEEAASDRPGSLDERVPRS